MIRVLNNFLNSFENFCWRLFIATVFLIAIPFVAIAFVFGFFSLKVKQEIINKDNIYIYNEFLYYTFDCNCCISIIYDV